MRPVSIELGRVSAFYTPTLVAFAGGYLQQEGLEPRHSMASPGKSSLAGLLDGSVQVAQSAPSRSLPYVGQGQRAPFAHFALVNARDGFFLVGRNPDPGFSWDKLTSASILADHAPQPLAMLRYAAFRKGIDFDALAIIDAGAGEMERAFRAGAGGYIHLQGPAAQQLEADGAGHIVAAIGDAVGPVAFTSLSATWEWLATDDARRFARAFLKAVSWTARAPVADVANLVAPYFNGANPDVLAQAISTYQRSGTWTPSIEISRSLFDRALDVFAHAGEISARPRYEDVIALPPS